MSAFTIEELVVPQNIDAPEAADFSAAVAVMGEVEEHIIGTRDRAWTPEEFLPSCLDPYAPRRLWVARVDGRIVALGQHELQLGDDERSVWFGIDVLPEYRRRGIGSALFEEIAAVARAAGDTTLQCYAQIAAGQDGERLASPTGFGSVPADAASTRFLRSRGYTLSQVNRLSRLTLPAQDREVRVAEGYELETWTGPTPEHRLLDIAVLQSRMSTDPPTGESEYVEEVWDEQRVREGDARHERDGRLWLMTAVRHVASDTLVGFTQIVAPRDTSRPAHQFNTIVLEEHRGHRLGMLLKLTNLRRLRDESGQHPCIYTWNAEENRPMLDVNEAMGFVPAGYEGVWKGAIGTE